MGMETDFALVISGVVVGIVKMAIQSGVSREKGIALALVLSLVGVLVYAFSFEPGFERILVWKYFSAFAVVGGTAISFVDTGLKTIMTAGQSRNGTGNGGH